MAKWVAVVAMVAACALSAVPGCVARGGSVRRPAIAPADSQPLVADTATVMPPPSRHTRLVDSLLSVYMDAQVLLLHRHFGMKPKPRACGVQPTAMPAGRAMPSLPPLQTARNGVSAVVMVARAGEGMWLSIRGTVLFESGTNALSTRGKQILAPVAQMLRRYRGTKVFVIEQRGGAVEQAPGEARARGRAAAVVDHLILRGISPDRLCETTRRFGRPLDRRPDPGRSMPRIEFAIYPTEQLREAVRVGGLDETVVESNGR